MINVSGEINEYVANLLKERDAAQAECEEQARLNGMGAQREAKLRAEVQRLRETVNAMKIYHGEARCHDAEVCEEITEDLCAELASARELIEKIADPRKRDHQEPDAYTAHGCVMDLASTWLAAHPEGEK